MRSTRKLSSLCWILWNWRVG